MKRETLKSLGLSDEQIDKVMAENGNDINALKAKITEMEEKLTGYQEQISERDKQLDSLKKAAGDSENLKEQISKLQESNKEQAKAYAAKIQQMSKDNALNLALTNAKAKNVKAVRALLDLDKVQLDGENLIGLEEQLTKLRESDAYMFDGEVKPVISGTKAAEGSGTPPAAQPGSYEHFAQMYSSGQTN